MQITKIKRIGTTNRYNLYADDVWQGIFLDEIIVKYSLAVGKDVELEKIKKENDEKVSFDMAVGYVEKYVTSEKGIKDYLKKKGFSPKIISKTLEKLKSYSLVDDEKFARNLFDSLVSTKGKRAIANKLRQKGVKSEIIENLLCEVDDESQLENAIILAKKFVKNRENSPNLQQKCLAHLIYKGYDYSVAQQASKSALEGEEYDRF